MRDLALTGYWYRKKAYAQSLKYVQQINAVDGIEKGIKHDSISP